VETGLAEAQTERSRLSTALDEANHRHLDEMNVQNSRFEALQARSGLTESLLEEARQTLMARADEIRTFERRVVESSTGHDVAGEKISRAEAALAERELQVRNLEAARTALAEQNRMLAVAVTAQESACRDAIGKIKQQNDLMQMLEGQLNAVRDAHELQVQQLSAQLQREQLERSMAEGALESGRKDIARLMREVAALQYRPVQATAGEAPPARPDPLRSAA
jgi:crescentin